MNVEKCKIKAGDLVQHCAGGVGLVIEDPEPIFADDWIVGVLWSHFDGEPGQGTRANMFASQLTKVNV